MFRSRSQILAAAAIQHNEKLFTAQTANGIMRSNRAQQTRRHLFQHFVACLVPVFIIDPFEMVDITKQYRYRRMFPL